MDMMHKRFYEQRDVALDVFKRSERATLKPGNRNPESGIRIPHSAFRFGIPIPDSGFRILVSDSGFRFPGFRVARSELQEQKNTCCNFFIVLR